jgi:pSer/pThr/pTyr-binding forkhead associated (FHA) protein
MESNMATLCLLSDNGELAERWEIGERPVAVGRDESADVKVADAALSRRHFMILREDGSYVLKDLDSENGTWVDGQSARKKGLKLQPCDCILAGRSLFVFSDRPSAEQAKA